MKRSPGAIAKTSFNQPHFLAKEDILLFMKNLLAARQQKNTYTYLSCFDTCEKLKNKLVFR